MTPWRPRAAGRLPWQGPAGRPGRGVQAEQDEVPV